MSDEWPEQTTGSKAARENREAMQRQAKSRPCRIQLSRKKGWRLPPNTVVVSRPTKWGNPFAVGRDGTREYCVALFYKLCGGLVCLSSKATPEAQAEYIKHAKVNLGKLRGMNLACWCPLSAPCHADVLLKLANTPGKRTRVSNKT